MLYPVEMACLFSWACFWPLDLIGGVHERQMWTRPADFEMHSLLA